MLKNFKQLQRSLTPHTVPQRADDEKVKLRLPVSAMPHPSFLKGCVPKESFPIVLSCAIFDRMPNYH